MLTLDICKYDKSIDQVEKQELELKVKATIPLSRKLGMFDLFPKKEWMQGKSPGRKFIGVCGKKP